jgi:hypothetical protein
VKGKRKDIVEIEAKCSVHGRFQVQRKPNKRPDVGSGRKNNGFYDAVKCPVCPFWATIVSQKLIEGKVPEADSQTSMLLNIQTAVES